MPDRKRPRLQDATDQAVHKAAESDVEELVRLLNRDPDLRDEPGWYWRQPIHTAGQSGNADTLTLLLERGADPNAEEGLHQETPLFLATEADALDCIQKLLTTGADPNKRSRRGETPLFVAHSLAAIELLANGGADMNVVDENGDTPFQNCGSYVGSIDVLRFWIERGVLIDAQPVVGWPALHGIVAGGIPERKVSESDRIEILRLLLDSGASVNGTDKTGVTVLYYACQSHFT